MSRVYTHINTNDISSNAERLDIIRDVYNKHYRAICYFAFKLIRDKNEAEDIAMDAFLCLLNKEEELKNINSVKSFLYKITYNKCVDYIRKQQSKNNYSHYIHFNEVLEILGTNEVVTAQVLQAIYEEIEKLPERQKIIFRAIYLEGKNTSIIANELNISQQTVLNQKSKAIQNIRIKLLQSGIEELLLLTLTCFLF